MLSALDIINIYISFFEKRKHKRIPNAALVPENDPTTLFTSSGMQPLVPYLLGEAHPQGKRLVNVQNSFRAQDIDETGDNRHTTFFRMLGNWSLGDYFKEEQLPMCFEFLTKELGISAKNLYVTVFEGLPDLDIPKDKESEIIWKELFKKEGIDPKDRIYYYGANKNWWSRSGEPKNMPLGEPGGPDSEIFYDFGENLRIHENSIYKNEKCHPNCNCGRFLEIGNSVFMQYKKTDNKLEELTQKNVDFGGGLERLLAVAENTPDIFQTNLFSPIVKSIEKNTGKNYKDNKENIRITIDHFVAATFIAKEGVLPSNKERGYILRRLIRRGLDNFFNLQGKDISNLIESIVDEYSKTDPDLLNSFEKIKNIILLEEETYKKTLENAKKYIAEKYKGEKKDGEIMGTTRISAQDAFILYSTHGLSPNQIKSLGYNFDEQEFARKMEEHQQISKKGAAKKFAGGLADSSEETTKGHTATHLLHQALKDVLGMDVNQKGSNITTERIRFDFNFERKLTDEEIKKVEDIVNDKIEKNLEVKVEIMPLVKAQKSGAIGLFNQKYQDQVKVYSIGNYSKEICGGPHVDFTGKLKRFKIIKQENIGNGLRRIYAVLEK
ncbi:alanine--tRNA ligase [Candidatus Microgenomates bacterium]|nr:MAG: alanine--tRNA ligase [Candidatus Microgenomates bacterium]